MHLFMITSWNKIGINIGDVFIFLAFDPEGEKWHPTPGGEGRDTVEPLLYDHPQNNIGVVV